MLLCESEPFVRRKHQFSRNYFKGGVRGDDYTHLSVKSFRSAPQICQQSVTMEMDMLVPHPFPPWAALGDCSVMNVRGKSDGQRWPTGTSDPRLRWALPSRSPFWCTAGSGTAPMPPPRTDSRSRGHALHWFVGPNPKIRALWRLGMVCSQPGGVFASSQGIEASLFISPWQ